MGKYLLGIDNGGTLTKSVLYDLTGNEIAAATVEVPMITPQAGFTERDMEILWAANCKAIQETLKKSGIDALQISGVACTGHGKGLYLWGKDGKPAYNGIVSTDSRAWEYSERWYADGTAEKVFIKTCQRILACQPVSLLRWLKDNRPGVVENTQWIFSVKDYIRYRLTGQAYGEITDFSGTNLVNLQTKAYDLELLNEFGLAEVFDKLPPLKYSADHCGSITKESAEKTGLVAGTPVAGGMFDIDACAVAMDVTDSENLCVIAGTWSINEYISAKPVIDGSIMMNSLFCLPGSYLVEESSPTSASNNEWFINLFLEDEKRALKTEGKNIYDLVNELVASVTPLDQNIIFLPYIYGSNYNPRAKACFIGMDSHHTRAHIMRAIYEGVAFCHMVHIEKLLNARAKPNVVRLAGGVANSDVWVQIFADVLNLPIEIIESRELGAMGCAMAAGVASGEFGSFKEAAKAMVRVKKRFEPNFDAVPVYEHKYAYYKQVSAAVEGCW